MDISNTVKYLEFLEQNGDKALTKEQLDQCQYSEPDYQFEFPTSLCHDCNGYYGPSFCEPVCLTCHAFLFPDYATPLPISIMSSEKTDDGDSGNDEPSDLNYAAERRANQAQININWILNQNLIANNSDEELCEESPPRPACAAPAVAPAQPPNVERRLHMLSTPRAPDLLGPQLLQRLPPEVLLWIFSYLDDLSLCSVGMVCQQWEQLLKADVPDHNWASYTSKRWPLYKPLITNVDWFKTYQKLMTSCFCYTCLAQMAFQSQPGGEENSWRHNRLRTEIKVLHNDPPEGIAAIPLDAKCCHWQATIAGPIGSPYEGGLFYLYLQVPFSYPLDPPVVRFLTKILHPNVSRHGDVGIDCIHHNWSLALTISKVLISVQSLLTDPYTKICMEPSLGHMYRTDKKRFEHLARQWTWKYAMHDVLRQT